jgi:cation transport regulator
MKAFNSAWEQYDQPEERRGGASREETAHKVAWAAVKKDYQKDDRTGDWKKKH